MKKRINTEAIKNELAGSVFFPALPAEPTQSNAPHPSNPREQAVDDTTTPRYHDTKQPSNHDTTGASQEKDSIEAVRKAVKQVGKEAATQRLTWEEKQALADIEYSYKRQGIRTSGNELTRIALNYIVEDYRRNGERSIVAQVLKKLNT